MRDLRLETADSSFQGLSQSSSSWLCHGLGLRGSTGIQGGSFFVSVGDGLWFFVVVFVLLFVFKDARNYSIHQ